MANNLAHSPANDTRFADLLKVAAQLGKTEGKAGACRPMLAKHTVKAARDGYVSTESPKDANGKPLPDDAQRLYEGYHNARNNNAVYDKQRKDLKVRASETRTLIRLGCMTTLDAVQLIARAEELWLDLDSSVRKSAWQAFVDVAKAQLADDSGMISDDQIMQAICKSEGKVATQADILKAAAKNLDRALQAPDADEKLHNRIADLMVEIDGLLAFLGNKATRAADLAKLAELQAKYGMAA